jgi:glycosyltransferase involved in cell wall biosynthesis
MGMLVQQLAERGHEVTWWTSNFDHMLKERRETSKDGPHTGRFCEYRFLTGPSYPSNISLRRVLHHIQVSRDFQHQAEQTDSPDLVVCSMPPTEIVWSVSRYCRLNNVPFLVDVRDLWPEAIVENVPGWLSTIGSPIAELYFGPQLRSMREATGIVSISEGYLDWALDRADRSRAERDRIFPLSYVPPNVDEEERNAAGKRLRAKGVDPEKTICWFVGIFGESYDLLTMVEAGKRLEEIDEDTLIVLSGGGDYEEQLRKEAAGVDSVVLTGMIDGPGLRYMSEVADVGLAAYAENATQELPNKFFEYLSAGLPLISSLGGEAQGIVESEDVGINYEAGSADALSDAIETLATDGELLEAMCENAMRLFEDRYDPEKVYREFADYLVNDIAQRGAPRT